MQNKIVMAFVLALHPASALAQSIATETCCTIPALTEVTISIEATVNSQANHAGERFPIRLVDPVAIDGKVLIPAGASGTGEIVHAAKSRFGGRAGELILAVRFIEHGGVRVPLRSLRLIAGRGEDRGDTAAAISIASAAVAPIGGVIAMFITGSEVNVPTGTIAKAKTSAPVTFPDVSTTGTTTITTAEKENTVEQE